MRGVQTPRHLYCQWVGKDGTRFNIETTSSSVASFPTDESTIEWDPCPLRQCDELYRPMNARELLGHFLWMRGDYYSATRRYRHAVVDFHNALLCYPGNSMIHNNLKYNLVVQVRDREYAESEELRSARPRMPVWNSVGPQGLSQNRED